MGLKRNTERRTKAPLARSGTTMAPAFALPAAAVLRRMGPRAAGLNTLAAAVAGILYCSSASPVYAQATAATAPEATSGLDEIVVTASANAVKKLDASYNIVSANAEQIKQASPVSTADILKLSPGIWPESSGGQTGANIEIAGFPGGGDAPYFTNMIEGSPMYGMPSLSFMDSSSLFRLDDTVQRVEIVQGGPGAIFGPGQVGATANFILKRGTATPTGSLGVTYGSEGMERVDGFYGFPISDGWYGSAGGFYRKSKGVRSPQFSADEGGQFTATVSHDVDGGSFMFWIRTLQDKNQFLVPTPLIENGNGSFSKYPGFDALTDSYGSHAIQHVQLPSPAGGFEGADLANGRGGNLNYFGFKYDVKFDTWTVTNNFLFDGGNLNTNALFSGPNPRPLSYYEYGCQVPQPTGFCNGAKAVDNNNYSFPVDSGAGLKGTAPAPGTVTANYVGGGAVPGDQSVLTQGWWFIQKQLQNITDEFRVSKEIFDGDTLTGGLYLAHYTDDDNWSLGNQMLMTNTPNARPITLTYSNGGHAYNLTSPQGIVNSNGNYNILEHGDGTNTAFYLSDAYKFSGFLVDASARLENIDVHQRTCNRTNQQLSTQYDLWDIATPVCNGTWDNEHYKKTRPSFTVGANYEIMSNMSVYVRGNTGVHFNDFDNGIRGVNPPGNFAPLQTVKNFEFGFKFQNSFAYVDVNAYRKQFTGLQYQETTVSGVPLSAISTYGSDSKGIDFISTVTPIENLNITLVGDYMDGHYTHYTGCAPYVDLNGANQCAAINGEPIQRQPKLQVRVTPSYKLVVPSFGDVTGWVTYEHVGQRYEDQSALQPLGAYYTLRAGIIADYGDHWQFSVRGTNLTNQIGLTEGNARKFGVNSGIGGVILARTIEGREVNVQAMYKF